MTKIEWVKNADGSQGKTWNPIVGCSIVSPGCTNCYAMDIAAKRLDPRVPHYAGTTKRVNGHAVWTGKVALAPDRILTEPLRRRKPTTYFVNSMGDLFHESVPDEWIDKVFAVMALAPQHTFMVLTKRSARMHAYMTKNTQAGWMTGHACGRIGDAIERMRVDNRPVGPTPHGEPGSRWWPLPNVMLGVTAEDQQRADERIPDLLATPAAKRFVSVEPMLGQVDLASIKNEWSALDDGCDDGVRAQPTLDWVICGGESGHDARPMNPDWARLLRDQCGAGGVPFFMKQMGGATKKSMPPIPDDLMLRETPHD